MLYFVNFTSNMRSVRLVHSSYKSVLHHIPYTHVRTIHTTCNTTNTTTTTTTNTPGPSQKQWNAQLASLHNKSSLRNVTQNYTKSKTYSQSDISPTSSLHNKINIVEKKYKQVTPVTDWMPYTGVKRNDTITSVVDNNVVKRTVSKSLLDAPSDNNQSIQSRTTYQTNNNNIYVDTELYPELQTIESIINSTQCINYYKMYMISNLQIENLLFYQEVQRFQSIINTHSNHIWNHFISTKATVTAINIPSTMRDSIYHELCGNWCCSVFDDAQTQVITLMNGHWRTFIDSKYCQAYVAQRYQQLVARGKIKEINKNIAG